MGKRSKEQKGSVDTGAGNVAKTTASFIRSPAEIDPALASLFANSSGPAKPQNKKSRTNGVTNPQQNTLQEQSSSEVDNDESLSSGSGLELESSAEEEEASASSSASEPEDEVPDVEIPDAITKKIRKRKRKQEDEEMEGRYMQRLALEEEREESKLEAERGEKRQKIEFPPEDGGNAPEETEEGKDKSEEPGDSDVEEQSIPLHESLQAPKDSPEFEQASRTVFLGNVSSQAIASKSAKKVLLTHLSSFLSSLPPNTPPHSVESFRFRSTAYSNKLPKKAAFAKKEIMDTTTKSTNAYVVYSTKLAAKEAAKRLNGTVVLDRHLRADEVAHPAKTDHHRCIFVGNLGFVDDESQIRAANEQEGERKQKKREPGDVEEGLWREFGKVGKVESVRVVRDPKTRVGKGFAYVQFMDENSVEAALLHNDKKFPPLLPRKLRVTRAKAVKRNAPTKDGQRTKTNSVYNPKVSTREKSMQGRARKMLGRAGAAQAKLGRSGVLGGMKAPESFVFEGHRASKGQGLSGLKLGGSGKKKGKPRSRSAKRGAAFKAAGGVKKSAK